MSQQYYGRDMDRPSPAPGSVRRARERTQAGQVRETLPLRQLQTSPDAPVNDYSASPARPSPIATAGPSRPIKPRIQPPGNAKTDQKMPRSTRSPQWPLPGPIESPVSSAGSGPSPGRSPQTPQRPSRPSDLPSISYPPQARGPSASHALRPNIPESPQDMDDGYNTLSPAPTSSRQTSSSVSSIPDFPVAAATSSAGGPPRRSAILGPPPSSRRGASSFYSNASFVSPIPEESPRSRSHGSYASSAAMPENWGPVSPMASPGYGEAFYDDSVTDQESGFDDVGDESRLVRSASIGKKANPSIVNNTRPAVPSKPDSRPDPSPVQPFAGGTAYMDTSTSSSTTLPMARQTPATTPATTNQTGLTPDVILRAYAAASSSDPAEQRAATGSPPPRRSNRLSNMRRPPKLDMDAVRAAEARGSLTSLPDLIKRATRLAAMIDKGKRPGSRMDDLGPYLAEKNGARDGEGSLSADERYQSGLSDMLAAFPPPVQTPRGNRHSRASWLRPSSWPVVADQARRGHSRSSSIQSDTGVKKQGRRCCGLPLWAFILVVFLLLCVIVAAIVIPLEFFVFKNLGNKDSPEQSLESCQKSLVCQNGGTNVMSQGVCSCICTNGFTGSNCTTTGSAGCTTTNLVATDGSSSINNVTLGRAIPRLIAEANSNFTVPLSGTIILAKLNSGNLSCIAQNSLVTFDGQSTRAGKATDEVEDVGEKNIKGLMGNAEEVFPPISIITFTPSTTTATVFVQPSGPSSTSIAGTFSTIVPPPPPPSVRSPDSLSNKLSSSSTAATSSSPTSSSPSASGSNSMPISSTAASTPIPTGTFTVTEEVVDFARVAMLYILQEDTVDAAESAQAELQRFFSTASKSKTQLSSQVTQQQAAKVSLGGNNTINLVDFTVDVGKGPVGHKNVKRALDDDEAAEGSQAGL